VLAAWQRHFRGLHHDSEQLGAQHGNRQRSWPASGQIIEPDGYHRRRLPG